MKVKTTDSKRGTMQQSATQSESSEQSVTSLGKLSEFFKDCEAARAYTALVLGLVTWKILVEVGIL